MVTLTCVALHPAIPALDPGVTIGISRSAAGGLNFQIPATIKVLAAILAALGDGALRPAPGPDPFWDEMEREIMATRDDLLARADQVLMQVPAVALLRAG